MRHKQWHYPERSTNGPHNPRTVYLSPADELYIDQLAKRAGCSPQSYLNELVYVALKDKRESTGLPNAFQRLATEAALSQSSL